MRSISAVVVAAALVGLGQPAVADESGRPSANDRKTGLTVNQPLKVHRDADYGFRFTYPASWYSRPGTRTSTRAKIGDGNGASCVVAVRPMELPSDSTGQPRQLRAYLGRLTQEQFQSRYPAKFQPRITSFGDATLGGQGAKRIVLDIVVDETIPMSLVQYVTYRDFGVVSLTCGARKEAYETPQVRRVFHVITRSFRF